MLVCFTSDLHGSRALYGQLADLLRAEMPDLLILGGDLLRDIDPDGPVLSQTGALERELIERVTAWRTANPGLTVALIPGNHELACTGEALRTHSDARRIVLLDHRQPWRCGDFAWLGYACTPPSPHWAKDYERLDLPGDPIPTFEGVEWDAREQRLRPVDLAEYFRRRPAIRQDLEQVPAVSGKWILVAHAPPHDSRLDRLPTVPHPIGSRAVRQFIADRQPWLALHGHVHESPQVTGGFCDRIGDTPCLNPGQDHGRLHAVLFEVERPSETLRHTVLK